MVVRDRKPKCNWLTSFSLLFMAFMIVWFQSMIITKAQMSSKMNELNLEEQIINSAGAAVGHRWNFRTKIPVFNVSGILSIHSIDGLDTCNRTYRIQMNQWLLDECTNISTICRGKRSFSFPSSSYDPFKDYLGTKYSSDELPIEMEDQEQEEESEIRRRPKFLNSLIRKRNNHHNKRSNNEAQQAQIVMDKCCKQDVHCSEYFLRATFQRICSPNLVVNRQVLIT